MSALPLAAPHATVTAFARPDAPGGPRRDGAGVGTAAAAPATVEARLDPDRQWEAWMAAAQAGDGRAYDAVLRAALPLLRGVCRRRLFDASEAEDAVADALLSIHRLRATYDPSRPLRPWLVAIAERRCVDRLRARGRRGGGREVELDEEMAADPAGATTGGEARVAARQLREAVAALPASQRAALGLAKIEGLTLAEASARSGLSVGALKVATHRALATLCRRLGAEGGR